MWGQIWEMRRNVYKILVGTPIGRPSTVKGLRAHLYEYFEDRVQECEMDGTSSELCAVAVFGISGVEPLGSATRDLVN